MSKAIRITNIDTVGNATHVRKHNKNNKRLKARYRLLIFLFLLLFISGIMFLYIEKRIQPIINSMAIANARSSASRIISESISEIIQAENISYDDMISFEKDTSGKISAVKANIVTINRVKSSLAITIANKLSNIDNIDLDIPVGNLINGEFFSGRGPKIRVKVIPVGSVATDIQNVFASAGINQTHHQIMLEVRVIISVILPYTVESIEVNTSICIGETVIIGDVPNMYATAGGLTTTD